MKIFRLSLFEVIIYIISITTLSIVIYSFVVKPKEVTIVRDTIIVSEYKCPDQTIDYLKALKQCEANGRYAAKNGSYDGGYQIGSIAKIEVGYAILNSEEGRILFREDSILQEEVMLRLLQSQIRIMRPYIQRYANTNIGNYWITTSGILAMSHLLGPDNTVRFLISRGKYKVKDGNNTDITRYLQFNNFNLPIDSIIKPSYINQYLIKYLKQ